MKFKFDTQSIPLIVVAAACGLATFINPFVAMLAAISGPYIGAMIGVIIAHMNMQEKNEQGAATHALPMIEDLPKIPFVATPTSKEDLERLQGNIAGLINRHWASALVCSNMNDPLNDNDAGRTVQALLTMTGVLAQKEELIANLRNAAALEPGWGVVKVNEHFNEFMEDCDRATRKGYMPDAMADSWTALMYNVIVPPGN